MYFDDDDDGDDDDDDDNDDGGSDTIDCYTSSNKSNFESMNTILKETFQRL